MWSRYLSEFCLAKVNSKVLQALIILGKDNNMQLTFVGGIFSAIVDNILYTPRFLLFVFGVPSAELSSFVSCRQFC